MGSLAVVVALGVSAAACVPEPPPSTTSTTTTSTTTTSTTTTTTTVPASTVDQSLTGSSTWGMGAFAAAQTFTAGRTGLLDKVALYSLQSNSVPVELSVQGLTASGAPSGVPLAAPTVLPAPVATSGLTEFALSTPVPVTAGVKYALVIDWIGGTGSVFGARGETDPYPGGEVWYLQYDIAWAQMGLVSGQVPDFLFQTWVL